MSVQLCSTTVRRPCDLRRSKRPLPWAVRLEPSFSTRAAFASAATRGASGCGAPLTSMLRSASSRSPSDPSAPRHPNCVPTGELGRFARRALDSGYHYLIIDARYEKLRENGVIAHVQCLKPSPSATIILGSNERSWKCCRRLTGRDASGFSPQCARLPSSQSRR